MYSFPVDVESGFEGIERGGGDNVAWQAVPVVHCSDAQEVPSCPGESMRFVQLERVTSSDPGLGKAEKPILHMHGVMEDLVDNYHVASKSAVG